MSEGQPARLGRDGAPRGARHLTLVRSDDRPVTAPAELLVDALLRLDAVRAALSAGDVTTLLGVTQRLGHQGARHGQHRLSSLLAQIVRAATRGDLDGVTILLDHADREVAQLETGHYDESMSAC